MDWIDIDEEMPKLDVNVLVKLESEDVVTGWLSKIRDDDIYFCLGNPYISWDYVFNFDCGTVTHWMPLPE